MSCNNTGKKTTNELFVVLSKKSPGLFAVAAKRPDHTRIIYGKTKQRVPQNVKAIALATMLQSFSLKYDIIIKEKEVDFYQETMMDTAGRNIFADLHHCLEQHAGQTQEKKFSSDDRLVLKYLNNHINEYRSLKVNETRAATIKTEKLLEGMRDLDNAPKKSLSANEQYHILKNSETYIVSDIETTEKSIVHRGEIIEIAALKIRNGEIIDTFSKFIKPKGKISAKTTELTHITPEMVENADPFYVVLREFHHFIQDCTMVFHNSQFDWNNFLLNYFKMIMLFPENKVVDSLKIAKAAVPGLTSYKLKDLATHFGVSMDGEFHRAIYDTEILHRIVLKLIDIGLKDYSDDEFSFEENENDEKPLFPAFNVTGKREWKTPDGEKHRIYVYTTLGTCYFDKTEGTWFNGTIAVNVDINELTKRVTV